MSVREELLRAVGDVAAEVGAVPLDRPLEEYDDPTATLLGLPVGSTTIFVIGLVAGVLLLFGLSLTKWGGKLQAKNMKERRQMRKLTKTLQDVTPESKDDN